MGAARMIVLVVAAIAALGLALIVRHVLHKAPPPAPAVAVVAPPPKPMTQVLVAHRDLAVGTRLADGDMDWLSMPAESVNPAFITNGAAALPPTGAAAVVVNGAAAATQVVVGSPMQAIYGSIVRTPIVANEPITADKIVRGGAGGYMSVVLHPGMSAFAVPVTVATAAGGFVLPGDRVDVMQSHAADTSNGGKPGMVADTLLRNVEVLAIDQSIQAPKGTDAMVGAVATLEIATSDVGILTKAKAQGEMILALRAYADEGGPSGQGSPGNQNEVHVFRNGQVSDVMVTP